MFNFFHLQKLEKVLNNFLTSGHWKFNIIRHYKCLETCPGPCLCIWQLLCDSTNRQLQRIIRFHYLRDFDGIVVDEKVWKIGGAPEVAADHAQACSECLLCECLVFWPIDICCFKVGKNKYYMLYKIHDDCLF